MQLESGRCCILLSRGTCTISANIIVHCKRLQEYVKSIFRDEKNVLKPETILQKRPIRIVSGAFRINKPYQLLSRTESLRISR